MKKLFAILALALMLVPGILMAQPYSYCLWNGDPVMRYGFNNLDFETGAANPAGTYNQPGPDYANIFPGQTLAQLLGCMDAGNAGSIPGCGLTAAPDTFCFDLTDSEGWTLECVPPAETRQIILNGAGYVWYQEVYFTAPCDAAINSTDTLIASMYYWNTKDSLCAPECGDCNEPNWRPASAAWYYHSDTLIVTVVAAPGARRVPGHPDTRRRGTDPGVHCVHALQSG